MEKLRIDRERVAHEKLQREAELIATDLAALEIGNVATEARPLVAADKKNFGGEVTKGVIAVVVNAILARAAAQDDAESSKKGKGGGGKKGESKSKKPTVRIRAPAPPPADAKKALLQKENMAALQAAMKDEAAQFACCQALEAWLASEQVLNTCWVHGRVRVRCLCVCVCHLT